MIDLRIVKGNDFKTAIEVHAYDTSGQEIQDFRLSDSTDIVVVAKNLANRYNLNYVLGEGNMIVADWPYTLPCATYSLEVSGIYFEEHWKFVNVGCLCIVGSNSQANIPSSSILTDDTYLIQADMTLYSGLVVHADWEAQEGEAGFIEHKPTIPTVPTNVSAFENDAHYLTEHQDLTPITDAITQVGQLAQSANTTANNALPANVIWTGTQDEYDKLSTAQKEAVIAYITEDE